MTRTKTFLTITAVTFALSACVVRPNEPSSNQYSTVSDNAQTANMQGPYYYRGSTNNAMPMNNDTAINANVIQAITRMPNAGASNLQVSSLNGVVTLRGVADSQSTAQSAVEAARQVPGVQRVDYDIELRRR